jgi:hypothetical protein
MKIRLAIVILGLSLGFAAKFIVAALESNQEKPNTVQSDKS